MASNRIHVSQTHKFRCVATIYRFTRITLVRVRGNCVQFEHFELHLVGTDKKEMVYIIRECVFKIATKLITANMYSRMICIPEPLNSFVFRVKSANLISHIIGIRIIRKFSRSHEK